MGHWTTEKCRNCNKMLTSSYGGSAFTIGVPFIDCPYCGTVNDRSNSYNEWGLLDDNQKMGIIFIAWLSSIIYGTVWGAIISFLIITFIFEPDNFEFFHLLIFIPVSIIMVGICYFFYIDMNGRIKRSNDRMKDISYINKLKNYGYM